MQFSSRKRRGLASLATTALVAGALTVPVALMASPAQAASGPIAYTCDLTLSGSQAANGGPRQATLTFDTDAAEQATVGSTVTPTLTATLTFDSTYSQLFVPSPVNRFGGSLTATTDTEGTAGTAPITFTQWDRGGGIGTPITAISMTGTGSWGDITPAAAGALDLGVSTLTGSLYMGTTFSPNNTAVPTTCTPNGPALTAVDTITAVEAPVVKDLAFTCAFGGNEFAYPTDIDLTARQSSGGQIAVTAELEDDMPNTAPPMVNFPGQNFVGTLGTALGDLTGSHTGDFQGGVPVAIPTLTGKVNGSGTSVDIAVEDFSIAVGTLATITCTLPAAQTFTVDVAPKPQPCIDAESAVVTAQNNVATATTAATAATAAVGSATSKVTTATKVATAASKSVTTASKAVTKYTKSVKKYTKAVKKAKSKKAKSKAKKSLSKAKKSLSKAKKSLSSAKKAKSLADSKLKAAKTQLASAKSSSTTANSNVVAANAALTAAQNAVNQNC